MINKVIKDLQKTPEQTIDFINRQQTALSNFKLENAQLVKENVKLKAEIEKLELLNAILTESCDGYVKANKTYKAEIDKLKKSNEMFTDIGKMYSEIKAEAYKKCIEKVKEKSYKLNMCHNDVVVKTDYQISGEALDNLLKEMVGDNNAKEKE